MSKRDSLAFHVPELTLDEARAIKSLYRGDASEYQQRQALATIIDKLCKTHDLSFMPESFSETSFLNGRAFVGKKILKIIHQKIEEETENE